MLIRADIFLGEPTVVGVRVMVVAGAGVMSVFEKRSFLITEIELESLGVNFGLVIGDILDLGGSLVEVVVGMEVRVVVRLV